MCVSCQTKWERLYFEVCGSGTVLFNNYMRGFVVVDEVWGFVVRHFKGNRIFYQRNEGIRLGVAIYREETTLRVVVIWVIN